jgi:catechol 2,3-dioxygenase-like lactoylglutathione lyase family enzyme
VRVKIEHTAYQVSDPVGLSRWYVEHLGLTVKRGQHASPFGHFLADDGETVMLEFYCHAHLPLPDYREMDPMLLHIAFLVDDVAATRARLLAAGATPEGDVQKTESGDVVAIVRDPCGLAVQLVHRKTPMLPHARRQS